MRGSYISAYSLQKDGQDYVSANFRVREFACQDGSDAIFISSELIQVLQNIRNDFCGPVTITSGFRTASHNKKIGGVYNSQHLYGMAADIMVSGVAPGTVYAYLDELYPDTYGIGFYKNFIHIDVRKDKSRWVG